MPDNKDLEAKGGSTPGSEVSVWEAIQTFETIIEAYPEDVNALEALASAYEQVGDSVRSREKSLVLARVLAKQGDWARVREITLTLLAFYPGDGEAEALRQQAQDNLGTAEQMSESPASAQMGPGLTSHNRLAFDLRGELELAWFLLQSNLITQEQYESAIGGLTESRMNTSAEASLSLLQEIRSMDRIDMEKIIDHLSAETGTPYVEISRCHISEDVAQLVPLDQCRRLGILPFGRVGKEIMVVVLNPVDKDMRRRLAAWLDAKVHFFMTSPDEFQGALDAVQNDLQRRKQKAGAG